MANDEPGNNRPYILKLVLLAAAVVVAIVLIWQMAGEEKPEEVPPVAQQPAPEPEPQPQPEPQEQAPQPVQPQPSQPAEPQAEPLPDLADSDGAALSALDQLEPNQSLRKMLVQDSVILKGVRAIVALAGGTVVNEYRPVKSPDSPFIAEKLDEPLNPDVGQRYRLSPRNYQRYDSYAQVLSDLDPQQVAAVYQRFYPLLEEAYAQHGVDEGNFRQVTLKAIDSILAAPVLNEPPVLVQPKVHYQFADPQLESLPSPQKLMIRMGPENTRKVQAALRQIRAAIEAQPQSQ